MILKINQNLTDLYGIQKSILNTMEFKHWQMIQTTGWNSFLEHRDLVDARATDKTNISHCLEASRKHIYSTVDKAMNESDECFGNLSATYEKLTVSTLLVTMN